jgi:hypothetical protein
MCKVIPLSVDETTIKTIHSMGKRICCRPTPANVASLNAFRAKRSTMMAANAGPLEAA